MIPWLALRLLGIRSALTGAFTWATASATRMLVIALCVSLAGNVWLWRGWSHEKAGRAADKAAYVAAQKEAVARQEQADQTNFAGQLAAIKQQDAAHAQLETARNDSAARFVTSHRMPAQTCRPASGAGLAPVYPHTPAPDNGSAGSDLVAIRPADIDAWSKVELQNAERGEFLRGLVDQGLGVVIPDVEFGKWRS